MVYHALEHEFQGSGEEIESHLFPREAKDDNLEQELALADKHSKREIRHLEEEIPLWQVIVETLNAASKVVRLWLERISAQYKIENFKEVGWRPLSQLFTPALSVSEVQFAEHYFFLFGLNSYETEVASKVSLKWGNLLSKETVCCVGEKVNH